MHSEAVAVTRSCRENTLLQRDWTSGQFQIVPFFTYYDVVVTTLMKVKYCGNYIVILGKLISVRDTLDFILLILKGNVPMTISTPLLSCKTLVKTDSVECRVHKPDCKG